MSKNKKAWIQRIYQAIALGCVLMLVVLFLAVRYQLVQTEKQTERVVTTLRQQCTSFNQVTLTERTQNLFRLTETVQDARRWLSEAEGPADDQMLETLVDELHITGLALLNENLELEASGYTRRFRDGEWMNTADGSRFADILTYPSKIFAERVQIENEYYDLCAISRQDKPGILIGFYRQPEGTVAGMENNMEILMTGLNMERQGNYAIAENGKIRAASDSALKDTQVSDSALLRQLDQLEPDGGLHGIRVGHSALLGYHAGCEGYRLYIYYPVFAAISGALMTVALFAAIYFVMCSVFFAMRNRVLYQGQVELRESNQKLNDTVKMLRSLETIYFTLFYVDLKENRYTTIYIAPWLKDIVPEKGIYTELKSLFLDTMIVPMYRDEVDNRMSIGFIRNALSVENITDMRRSFYTDFQAQWEGEPRWCRVSATVVDYDEDGKPLHVLALLQDVHEEKAKELDALTGVMGRGLFLSQCIQLQKKQDPGEKGWFLFIDVDWFKQINDTLGHAVGDDTLRQIAFCLQQRFSDCGVVGRVGGDEFAVMIEQGVPKNGVEERLKQFLNDISTILPERTVSCSIGGYRFAFPQEMKKLLTETDDALYRAKAQGRACYVLREAP